MPRDKAKLIKELRQYYSLFMLLKIANIPRSSFYYHRALLESHNKYKTSKQRIADLYHKHKGRYGYRRITAALKQLGVCHKHKLMRQMSLGARIRVQKYRSYKGVFGKIAHNYLQRHFDADRPTHRWLTDITEFKVGDNKLYLSPILDCYNNEIVSYSVSRRPTYELVSKMLDKALTNRKVSLHKPLMLHSDQRWHYQMRPFAQKLKEHKIQQSMSRKGNCLDNALMESFFGTLKCEMIYIDKPKTIEALEKNFMSTFMNV